ncbi:MAG: fused MFS/spermidine synthase [Saprospirales bacterium]|nr:fused MFS/spermidine synthase [Saprospirales bacterium]MBK8493075.1 fused MFS/spermidine synthase [Saprospirales bacterium]
MNRKYLFLLSFLEGSAVMACELIGAKMLAPYFGTSLYVWAAALGLTLGGLMTGYFTGGLLSKKYQNQPALLYWIMIAAGFFTALMPYTSEWIMQTTLAWTLQWGAVFSLLIFMFPPLVFMGMVSPVIINLLNTEIKDAGNSAGTVYAISTFGGILTTFLFGFYIIPQIGINYPAVITGVLLSLLPIFSLMRLKIYVAAGALLPLLAGLLGMQWKIDAGGQEAAQTLYHSEGILGQVKVADLPLLAGERTIPARALIVNNTLQTVMSLEDPAYDFWQYTKYIPLFTMGYPEGSKVLLLGMGGGTLVSRIHERGMKLDVVEIDGRMKEVAVNYFGLPPDQEVFIDDARHFLKTAKGKYPVIIYDTFISESAPEHILTMEGLNDARQRLTDDGVLLINFYGYLEGNRGAITRCVYKTLQAAGFYVDLFTTPGSEQERNLLLIGSLEEKNWADLPVGGVLPGDPADYFIPANFVDTTTAKVLTDKAPQLEMYARASADWRKLYNQSYTLFFSKYKKY